MRNRSLIIAAAITVGLLVTGIAWAAQDSRSDDSAPTTQRLASDPTAPTGAISNPSGTAASPAAAASTSIAATVTGSGWVNVGNEEVEYPIDDAGFVTIRRSGNILVVVSTRANSGWVVEIEVAQGHEVEGDFRFGSRRVKFNFELEDGTVRVRVEAEDSTSATTAGTATTSTTSTTSTTGTSVGLGLLIPNGPVTYSLDGAGTVTVVFVSNVMTIGSINPAAGWTVGSSEQHGDEIEVELRNGEQEAELKVEIENGQVRVEVEHKS